jgi:hypothetical protein
MGRKLVPLLQSHAIWCSVGGLTTALHSSSSAETSHACGGQSSSDWFKQSLRWLRERDFETSDVILTPEMDIAETEVDNSYGISEPVANSWGCARRFGADGSVVHGTRHESISWISVLDQQGEWGDARLERESPFLELGLLEWSDHGKTGKVAMLHAWWYKKITCNFRWENIASTNNSWKHQHRRNRLWSVC